MHHAYKTSLQSSSLHNEALQNIWQLYTSLQQNDRSSFLTILWPWTKVSHSNWYLAVGFNRICHTKFERHQFTSVWMQANKVFPFFLFFSQTKRAEQVLLWILITWNKFSISLKQSNSLWQDTQLHPNGLWNLPQYEYWRFDFWKSVTLNKGQGHPKLVSEYSIQWYL